MHHELLRASAELANLPEADFQMREVAKLPLTDDRNVAFYLYKDTSSAGGRLETSHKLDFHVFGRGELLGVEMPPLMNSVCMTWEKPDSQPKMIIRRHSGGQEVQDTVAQLVDNGILTDSSTAERVAPIHKTLESFVTLCALDDTGDECATLRAEAGHTFVTESNHTIRALGHTGTYGTTIRMERYADATYLEVGLHHVPEQDRTKIKVMQGTDWICYEEPYHIQDDKPEPKIRIFEAPALPGGYTKSMICEQVEIDLGDDGSPTDILQEMIKRGALVQPTLQSEHTLHESTELLSGLVAIVNDAKQNQEGWAIVSRSPW